MRFYSLTFEENRLVVVMARKHLILSLTLVVLCSLIGAVQSTSSLTSK
jgi:hypothetical protein